MVAPPPSPTMRAIIAILTLTTALLTLACNTTADEGPTEPAPAAPPDAARVAALVGAWDVTSIEGLPVVAGSPLHVEFTAEGRFVGNAGVNHLGASYSLDGGGLSLSPIASTMMAGPEPLMQQEQRMTTALARVRSATVEGSALVLRDGGGAELVRAQKR